jgi:hypothetical protein
MKMEDASRTNLEDEQTGDDMEASRVDEEYDASLIQVPIQEFHHQIAQQQKMFQVNQGTGYSGSRQKVDTLGSHGGESFGTSEFRLLENVQGHFGNPVVQST